MQTSSSSARASGRYVTFQISGRYFALPEERIREMMPMQPLDPWPGSQAGVLGSLRSRGRAIPIFDFRSQLKLGPRGSSRQERLIVIRSHDGFEFGFAADKITDCIRVHAHEIRDASIIGHGRIRVILDPDVLVDQERLFAVTFSSSSRSRA